MPEIDWATASPAEIEAAVQAERDEVVRELEEDPGSYVDMLTEAAAARHLELVKDVDPSILEEGVDAWIDEVESRADTYVIPEIEEQILEVESPWAGRLTFEFDADPQSGVRRSKATRNTQSAPRHRRVTTLCGSSTTPSSPSYGMSPRPPRPDRKHAR